MTTTYELPPKVCVNCGAPLPGIRWVYNEDGTATVTEAICKCRVSFLSELSAYACKGPTDAQ